MKQKHQRPHHHVDILFKYTGYTREDIKNKGIGQLAFLRQLIEKELGFPYTKGRSFFAMLWYYSKLRGTSKQLGADNHYNWVANKKHRRKGLNIDFKKNETIRALIEEVFTPNEYVTYRPRLIIQKNKIFVQIKDKTIIKLCNFQKSDNSKALLCDLFILHSHVEYDEFCKIIADLYKSKFDPIKPQFKYQWRFGISRIFLSQVKHYFKWEFQALKDSYYI